MWELALVILGFLLGASVGSFINVVADRLPRGESIVAPASHCPNCGHVLGPHELVPVFSYIAQRARCRVCGERIPARVPLVEVAGGATFALLGWHYGLGLDTLLLAVTFSFLLLIAIIDLEHKLVLNSVLLVALPVAVVSAPLWSSEFRDPVWEFAGGVGGALADAALAGTVGLLVMLVIALVTRLRGMGMGDVKLALVIGFWVGLRRLPVALYVAVILGGIVAILLVVSRRFGRKDEIPFAPFLCFGTAVALVWGDAATESYLELVS